MIEICSNCGNYEWDKEIIENKLRCPKCGAEWEFKSLPLLILTGCSGVGKTTTAIEIMRRKVDFVVLDADIFTGFINWDDEESCNKWVEIIANISKDIIQSGTLVLWTMAGCLDRFPKVYNSRYFSEIICLALVTDTSFIISSPFCPKKGRNRNIIKLQSSKPNTKSLVCFSFCLLSSSAILSISSPDNNSSIDTEKNFEIAFNDSILGTPLPDSHLEIAVRDTNNASASSSCVSPFSFLNSCNFSLNSIINIPFALRYECILY